MPSYPISIFWSHEDDAYIAMAPDLEGCSAGGATAVEALQELQIAMTLWLGAAQKMGKPLPKPSLPKASWSVKKRRQPVVKTPRRRPACRVGNTLYRCPLPSLGPPLLVWESLSTSG